MTKHGSRPTLFAACLLGCAILPLVSGGAAVASPSGRPGGHFPLKDIEIQYVHAIPGKHARPYTALDKTITQNFIQAVAEGAAGSMWGNAVMRSEDDATQSTSYYLNTERSWLAANDLRLVRVAATVVAVGPSVPGVNPNTAQQWTLEARIKFAFLTGKGTFQVGMNYEPKQPGWIAVYSFWVTKRHFPRRLQSAIVAPALTTTDGQPTQEATGAFSLKSYDTSTLPGPPPPPPFNKDGYVSPT